jgi:hypothetical protein
VTGLVLMLGGIRYAAARERTTGTDPASDPGPTSDPWPTSGAGARG